MDTRERLRLFFDLPVVEWSLFAIGLVLMLLAPVVGVLPGPGGIVVFAIGLALVLRTSMWAKRRYVRFKRWQPKAGHWMDWGMRRRSALRRARLRRQERAEQAAGGPDPADIGQVPIGPAGGAPIDAPREPSKSSGED